jgi:predicted RND superfamily exporter protein
VADSKNPVNAPLPDAREGVIASFIRWVVRRPGLALLGSILLIGGMASGALRIHSSKDIRVFFRADDPELLAYDALEATYAKSNSVLFVMFREDGGTIFSKEAIGAMQYLTDEAWKMPFSRRVDSLTNYQHSYAEGDDLMVEDLASLPGAEMTEEDIATMRQRAMDNPLLVNRLVSSDGKVMAANAPVILPGEDETKEQPAVSSFARALVKEVEQKFPGIRVYLTGIVMINQALDDAVNKDGTQLVPLMFVIIIISLTLLLRSISLSIAAFAVIIGSIVSGFGMAGWLGITLSPTVLSAVNMIMTLAIADSVHLLVGFRDRFAAGATKADAMAGSIIGNLKAVFLTSFTTVLGFLSLNTSDSPPFRDLGNVVAIGVTMAWFLVHILLPALVVLLPTKGMTREDKGGYFTKWMPGLAEIVIRQRNALLIAGLAVTVGFGVLIFRNELNDEFVEYFDDKMDFRVATDFTIDHLTGFEYLDYSLSAGEPGGISDPEYLKKVDAFADWYRQQPKVKHVYAYTDLLKRLHKNLHEDKPEELRLPDERQVAADCLMMYEMSLPFGLDLTDQIDIAKSSTLFKVSLTHITSNELQELDRHAQAWLAEHKLLSIGHGTGQSMMFAHIGPRNIKNMLIGTVGALVLISFCMIFITRSLKFGLISLLPNLAPAAIGFGIWGVINGQVGLAISVVVGMTLGIVVDDTIHFLTKYTHYRRNDGLSPEDSIRKTMKAVGDAMITTTITLVIGFGVLAFSTFELNSSMGLLSAIVIAVAVVFDLLVLPCLLLLLANRRPRDGAR